MTRSDSVFLLHRAFERVSAGAAAVALTILSLMTVDARADERAADPAPSITVSYSEIAVGSTAGATKVYRKLKAAARKVCGVNSGTTTLEMRIAARDCYNQALTDAVRKIDRPTLTALHATSIGNLG